MERKGQAERNKRLNKSKAWLRTYMLSLDQEADLYKHLAIVAGLGLRGNTSLSPTAKMRKQLLEVGRLDEYHDIYLPFRWGQTQMRTWLRDQIRTKRADEQMFIKYYKAGSRQEGFGLYKLVSVGKVPRNWLAEGNYLPIEMREEF